MKLIIKAQKTESGYIAKASNGEVIFEGRTFATRRAVYADLAVAYAPYTTWAGRKINSGFEITID